MHAPPGRLPLRSLIPCDFLCTSDGTDEITEEGEEIGQEEALKKVQTKTTQSKQLLEEDPDIESAHFTKKHKENHIAIYQIGKCRNEICPQLYYVLYC